MTGWPVRFGDAPPPVGPAPLLGQHSGEVLADWLGVDADAIDALRLGKVIAEPCAAPACSGDDGPAKPTR
jgi:crotonobetainyl-CoA:carnitine CoA-transferase CaiB-like acyl-CoA transferase